MVCGSNPPNAPGVLFYMSFSAVRPLLTKVRLLVVAFAFGAAQITAAAAAATDAVIISEFV